MRVRIAVAVWPDGRYFATGGKSGIEEYDQSYDVGTLSDIEIVCQGGYEIRWIDVEVDDHSSLTKK